MIENTKFSLKNKVAVITGGAGLLGVQHAKAIAEAGGIPILWDINNCPEQNNPYGAGAGNPYAQNNDYINVNANGQNE